ncbi:unnamed protein product [Fraxinus pennsylvanica]|uniref:Uncharacterized protein n=1 Tax=Fraxinus pennsylvanica TaxID=56036 RepID=A0AAD1ZR03_9LAMI|nr:unnamed protein product [Fraxinus pennsylvanica]
MKSLSRVGLGLSVVLGCLLLALIAELYYLLWWKKKITESGNDEEEDSCHSGTGRELLCCKKASSSTNAQQLCTSNTLVHEPQPHRHLHVYSNLKPFGEDLSGVEAEIRMLQQNFSGPPRFLFTITEETREEMESEDDRKSAKKSRSRSLSDLVEIVETPFLTPLANSPPYFTPPLTPKHNQKQGFNPFCELASDAAFNSCLRSSSPPPKFQFLKDAEYKLQRKQLNMNDESVQLEVPSTSMFIKDEENGSFITLIVAQNKQEEETNGVNNSSTSSQVFSLPSSSLNFKLPSDRRPMHQKLNQN